MSALVFGCFVPDFPYLVSLSPRMYFGHTLPGMFLLDLPLALASLWLFHTFVKQPMLLFLPAPLRRRLRTSVTGFSFSPLTRFGWLVLSVLVGTATHLVWDAFTHPTTWVYHHWGFLRIQLQLPVLGTMVMYAILEYGSSILGLLVVAIWIWHWYRTTQPSRAPVKEPLGPAQKSILVAALPTLAILVSLFRANRAEGIHPHIRPLVHFTADTAISAITLFLLGLLICGVILRLQKNTNAEG